MGADVKELAERLRDEMGSIGGPSYTQMMQQRLEAATALEAQAAYIDDVTAEHEAAVKQLMREVEIARDMGEINYRKWAEESARAEVQAEEIKRLRQENVGASALEALGLDPSGAFREVALALKERAEAAERERDALKLNVQQLEEFIGRREDDILSIARERNALRAEVDRLRASLELAANRLDRLALEDMPLKADALDWGLLARAALYPTQEGE